jgi:hypothetical protein
MGETIVAEDADTMAKNSIETTTEASLEASESLPEGPNVKSVPTTDRILVMGEHDNNDKDDEAATEGTDGSLGGDESSPAVIVSSTKKSRPPYKYDPDKITLRFLFANRDGLTVTVECDPSDTVGEAKGALLSVWPKGEAKHISCSYLPFPFFTDFQIINIYQICQTALEATRYG